MSPRHADLRDYYEKEAARGLRVGPRDRRVELRDEFVALLHDERRGTVIDFGAGPGVDASGFEAASIDYVGLDLAHGNGRLAESEGRIVLQGSITAVPIAPATFAAGWSMSTLMHLDDADAALAVEQMCAALQVGAPFLLGMWGREDEGEVFYSKAIPDATRPFHLRSFAHNQAMLAAHATVEHAERWDVPDAPWDYHVFRLRTAGH